MKSKQVSLANIQKIPEKTGIYRFFDHYNQIIYIGKSVNVKKRVASYFYNCSSPRQRIHKMIAAVDRIEYQITNSELLALLLEDSLIKKHLPPYNIKQKKFPDYRYMILTDDKLPALLAVNKKDKLSGTLFGPFPDRFFLEKLEDFISENFHLCMCSHRQPFRKCLRYDMKICHLPPVITHKKYQEIAIQVQSFLSGQNDWLLKQLQEKMEEFAQRWQFEEAEKVKRDYTFAKHFIERQAFFQRFLDHKLKIVEKNSKLNKDFTHIFEKGNYVENSEQFGIIDKDFQNDPPIEWFLDRANLILDWSKKNPEHLLDFYD